MNHLRLLLRRRDMVSLIYDASTGRLCGELAIDIVQQLKQHAGEATQPSSFRFHMATSLGGALLILATLITRDLSPIGLELNLPSYVEKFQEATTMLHDLAIHLQAARRIVHDLRDITDVARTIIDGRATEPLEDPVWAVPEDFDGLFPYGSLDFALQAGVPDPGEACSLHTESRRNDTVRQNAFSPMGSWDSELQQATNGYGAPWI